MAFEIQLFDNMWTNLIGTSYQSIQKYEIGETRISSGRLYVISKALRVPVETFYHECEPGFKKAHQIKKALQQTEDDPFITACRSIKDPKTKELIMSLIRDGSQTP